MERGGSVNLRGPKLTGDPSRILSVPSGSFFDVKNDVMGLQVTRPPRTNDQLCTRVVGQRRANRIRGANDGYEYAGMGTGYEYEYADV